MFRTKERKETDSVNAGSMADIAFLLLIFFLVSTTIQTQKGLMLPLPAEQDPQTVPMNERNIYKIRINSKNELLVEGEPRLNLVGLKEDIKTHVLNEGRLPNYSINPKKAIISLKTNRGTNYETFINVLDEIKGAYYQIYGERVGLSADEYRALDKDDPLQYDLYLKGKEDIPMNISIAEPDNI